MPGDYNLAPLVGQPTYSVWMSMLRELVPDGRTHRLAPLVAGMLQYAVALAEKQEPIEGSVAHALIEASETDPDETIELLLPIVECLFKDAGVDYKRRSSRGEGYSIAKTAIEEFVSWYDMPWE